VEIMVPKPQVRHALTWLAFAALVGFLVPAVFSAGLRWTRPLFLVPYVTIAGAFLLLYFRRVPVSLAQLTGRWHYALAGVAAASFFLLRNVLGQPASAAPEGAQLVLALAWIGVVYGAIDGLLLNVLPVLAVQGPGFYASNPSWRERLTRGLLALAASVAVTVAYHAGYTEFHGPRMLSAIIGNAIITSSYLLTGSPLAAVATHVIMHAAAVFHGMETTLQLPPHYGS
jgi:hypothetical protein